MPVPPLRARLLFWVLGTRVRPEHRPWAAQQITAPGFSRRRMRGVLALQVAVVALPQALLAATSGGWFNLVLALGIVAVFAVASRFAPATTPAQQQRLLAHQGVTATGELVPPVSLWALSPLTRSATVVLVANSLVLGTGIVVAADRFVSPDRCRDAPAARVATIDGLLGRSLPDGPPAPVAPGTARLERTQRVNTVFDGIYYLAGEVRAADGRRLGPAVWRVIEPGSVLPVPEPDISAVDPAARELTPTLGSSPSEDASLVDKVRSCVRDAG